MLFESNFADVDKDSGKAIGRDLGTDVWEVVARPLENTY